MSDNPKGYTTEGYVVTTKGGLVVWVGNSDVTESPTFKVYHDIDKARAALRRIHRATEYHFGSVAPLRVARVTITVEKTTDPIVPARRKRKGS